MRERSTKGYKAALLLIALFLVSLSCPTNSTYGLTEHSIIRYEDNDNRVEIKFDSQLWEDIQQLKANETAENLSLIIWLVENPLITGMRIEDLKERAVSLFTDNHSAVVYSVCEMLPVIMAEVPVIEAEEIATYKFVESIGDAEKEVYNCLDVSRRVIRANEVEAVAGFNGSGITIAILDSGINSNHPDLDDLDDDPVTNDPKVINEISFVNVDDEGVPGSAGDPMDYFGHGTQLAGIAAGTGEASNYRYVGVAPGARLMNVKVIRLVWEEGLPRGSGVQGDVVDGINWALTPPHRADVICMSLAGPGGNGTSLVAKAADYAVDQGVVVVVAAGNDGPGSQTISTPGDAFNVITVGASYDHNTPDISDDTIWIESSRGPTGDGRPKPDLVAPGENIISTISRDSALWQTFPQLRVGNFYFQDTGTSYATPHVAGVAVLLLQAHPDWSPHDVKATLKMTARLNGNLAGLTENDRGAGIVDALRRFLKVTTYDFTQGADVDRFAYSLVKFGPQLPSPDNPSWKQFDKPDAPTYQQIMESDDVRAVTSTGEPSNYPYHKFCFNDLVLPDRTAAIGPYWEGYGEADEKCNSDIFLWNWNDEDWDHVHTQPHPEIPDGYDVTVIYTITSDFEDYVEAGKLTLMVRGPVNGTSYLLTDYAKVVVYEPVSDVAVTSVTLPYDTAVVYPSWEVIPVTVTVKNEGDFNETFQVTAYCDTTTIGTQTVTLSPGESMGLTFNWDAPDIPKTVPYPTYTLSAEASVVPGEIYLANNHISDGTVTVRWPGDADGDGHVKEEDQAILEAAYVIYDPRADFNGDGAVNDADSLILDANWHIGPLDKPDVAVIDVTFAPPVVYPGETFDVDVTVKNEGNVTETFQVNAYCGSKDISAISPTGHKPSEWADSEYAYDDKIGTDASYCVQCGEWSPYLILTHAPLTSGKLRFWADSREASFVTEVNIDVYKDGEWVPVYNGSFTYGEWVETTYTPGSVSKARIRGYNVPENKDEIDLQVWEFDFGAPQTVADLAPSNQRTLTFTWNKTDVPPGNHIISAEATPVQGEVDKDDNNMTGGTITIIGHDIAVTSITLPYDTTVVYPAWENFPEIQVIVKNEGNFSENFTVTAYHENATTTYPIGVQNVTNLAPGETQTLSFTWNTSDIPMYEARNIFANASVVPDEIDTADNTMAYGTVTVRRIGDVNGDGHCKGADLTLFSVSWWLEYGDPYYYPSADFNGDGEVKGPDFTLLAMYWYEYSWTPPPPPGAARVYVDPVTVTADVGETFTVSVKVMNVTDLYSWSVGLQWDPAVLECIGASYIDTFLPDSAEYPNKYLDIEGEVNNTAGMIHPPYSRSLSYPNVAGINGNGTLMTATFQVKERGETWINLTEVYLYNTTEAGEIPLEVDGAYVRPGWISPTGHEEGIGWTNPANVYDGVIATTTVSPSVEGNDWTTYLVLNHSAITSNKIRFWQDYSEYISVLQIDVFKDGDWVNVFEASPPDTDMDWTEATYDPGLVTKARIRAKGTAQEEECYLEIQEFEFWEILG